MIYLIFAWYFTGVLSLIFLNRKADGKTTFRDIIAGFTMGGIGGFLIFVYAISITIKNDWLDKKVF